MEISDFVTFWREGLFFRVVNFEKIDCFLEIILTTKQTIFPLDNNQFIIF